MELTIVSSINSKIRGSKIEPNQVFGSFLWQIRSEVLSFNNTWVWVLWFAYDGVKEIKKLFTAIAFPKPVIFYNSHNTIFQSSIIHFPLLGPFQF